uniref:Homeobox domain-containing protein n=1 Tax=Globodera pallida TaxID=36090 RepID=A0A183BPX7_GLOPA
MLFFPPPAPEATDLMVDTTAVDGLLLSTVLMARPSELEQQQRNLQQEQLQHQLFIMEQQLQQQIPPCGGDPPLIQPNVPNSTAPFGGLLSAATQIAGVDADVNGNDMLAPTSAIMPNLEKDGSTCFVRDGFLFCHRDYFTKFGKPCERCGIPISRGELVMKVPKSGNSVEQLLFHIQCFSCVFCGQLLSPGQQFAVGLPSHPGGALFCSAHFHLNPAIAIGPQYSHKMSEEEQVRFLAEICSSSLAQCQQTPRKVFEQLSTGLISPNNSQIDSRNAFMESVKENPEAFRLSSASVTPNGTEAYCAGQNGGSSNGGETPAGNGGNGRQKRMRTSFKHHQLRTMKSYFIKNHNPDAKDLKQLAQKTGLTKRVLQVWFQNARAKHRRTQQHRGDIGGMDGSTPSLFTAMSVAQMHAASVPSSTSVGGGGAIHGEYTPNVEHSLPPPQSVADLPPMPPMFVPSIGTKANSAADSPNGPASMGPRSVGSSSSSSFSSAAERSGSSFENEAN